MIRFLITYDTPRDPAAFDPHYRDVHQPLTTLPPGIHNHPVHRAPRSARARRTTR